MQTLNNLPPSMDWRVYRNDSTVMTLVLVDTNDAPIDLTDWDFTGYVRQLPTGAPVLAALDIIKNANVLTVGLDTTELDIFNFFDIQGVNDNTGTVSTIVTGNIYVEEDVTR